jgi:hypothetical protein
MSFLPHILSFSHSVALLCSSKNPSSETKNLIFRINQKSLKRVHNQLFNKSDTACFTFSTSQKMAMCPQSPVNSYRSQLKASANAIEKIGLTK